METICQRFPHLGKLVLNNLDNQSLINCKEASRIFSEFLESERFFWITILRTYQNNFNEFKEAWKEVINKTSIEMVKQLAVAALHYFKIYPSYFACNQPAPINIAVKLNDINLCTLIYEKPRIDKNPKDRRRLTPLHEAAKNGSFELCKFMLENIHIAMKNPADVCGDTPFHYAVKYNRLKICQLFIANIDGQNAKASILRAKGYAEQLRHLEILELLNEKNTEIKVTK